MILSKVTTVKWNGGNKKYYESKGYQFTKYGDEFYVKVQDLTKGNTSNIQCLCDMCLQEHRETIIIKKYNNYYNQHKNNPNKLDLCTTCRHKLIGIKKRNDGDTVLKLFAKKQLKPMFKKEDYRNSNQQLPYICLKHKDQGIKYITYEHLKKSKYGCSICFKESRKNNIKDIYKEFTKKNLIPQFSEDQYINNKQLLPYICSNHKSNGIQYITYDRLKQSTYGCPICANEIVAQNNKKYDIDFCKKAFSDMNFILLDNSFINCNTKMQCKCKKHADIIQYKSLKSILQGHMCFYCQHEHQQGEGHPRWNGGITNISNHLRGVISDWMKESMKACGYKCVITKQDFDVVHHLYSFNSIIEDVFYNLNLDIKPNINQYTNEEMQQIENECISLHFKYGLGVCLNNKVHQLFHSIYGYGNNTREQFNDFVNKISKREIIIT